MIAATILDVLIAAGAAQPEGTPAHRAAARARFERHLAMASAIVDTWPAWKQNLLAGCALSGKADCRDCTCFDDGPLF